MEDAYLLALRENDAESTSATMRLLEDAARRLRLSVANKEIYKPKTGRPETLLMLSAGDIVLLHDLRVFGSYGDGPDMLVAELLSGSIPVLLVTEDGEIYQLVPSVMDGVVTDVELVTITA